MAALDYFVGNLSRAELGEKRDVIWVRCGDFVFGFFFFFPVIFFDLALAW